MNKEDIIGFLLLPLVIWMIIKTVSYAVYTIRKAWLKAEADIKK